MELTRRKLLSYFDLRRCLGCENPFRKEIIPSLKSLMVKELLVFSTVSVAIGGGLVFSSLEIVVAVFTVSSTKTSCNSSSILDSTSYLCKARNQKYL